MSMRVALTLTMLMGLVGTFASAKESRTASGTVVGVVEFASDFEKTRKTEIKGLFEQTKEGWGLIADSGRKVPEKDWTVAFDGKRLFASAKPPSGFNPPVRPAGRFERFSEPPKYRPLLAVAGGGFADPDEWKPLRETVEIQKWGKGLVETILKANPEFAKWSLCPGSHQKLNRRTQTSYSAYQKCAPFERLVPDWAFRSKRDGKLVSFKVETTREDYEELQSIQIVAANGPASGAWKILFPGPKADYDPESWSLTLIEAADVDKNGGSELLFEASGYNSIGYRLYSSDGMELARTTRTFH